MKRKEVFQFSRTNWYPKVLKRDMHEFMTWFVGKVNAAKPFMKHIEEVLEKSETKHLVNIDCHLGAGVETVKPYLNSEIKITTIPIENFNTSEKGVYIFVNSFHQLNPEKAKKILNEIITSNNNLIVVEGNNDSLWQVVGMTVFVPLSVILSAPFVKPFRWTRLLFTYLIPILPLVTMIDGFLALFKLYNPSDLIELTTMLNKNNYEWIADKDDNGRGGKIMYLKGINKSNG